MTTSALPSDLYPDCLISVTVRALRLAAGTV